MTTYQGQAAKARESRKLLLMMMITGMGILVMGMTMGAITAIASGMDRTPAEIGLLSCTEFLADLEESEFFQ